MELYTTLEPCLMCTGSILLHRIGTVVFGSADSYGGASSAFSKFPPYFKRQMENTHWEGPSHPAECDPLNDRVMLLVEARRIRPDA
jgi:tRNA(Arg) A34 adenosine deaminase TadA